VYARRALLISAAAIAGSAVPGAARSLSPAPRRVLLVGDSITMGSAGDYTWRYRLAEHLRAVHRPVDLVGVRTDIWDNVGASFGCDDYLDPDFDQDHDAVWGRTLEQTVAEIHQVATQTTPDVYVVMLGTNDLALGSSPRRTAGLMRRFVRQARAVTPDADLVLVQPPHAYLPPTKAFGRELVAVARALHRTDSRVTVAHTQEGFTDADTWDGVHPNARGEIKIAAGVADALARLGIGRRYERPLRRVPVGPRVAASVRIATRHAGVRLRYDSAPGVDREYVWRHDVTSGAPWQRLADPTSGGTWRSGALTPGHRYTFMLQPAKGRLLGRVRSQPVSAVIP